MRSVDLLSRFIAADLTPEERAEFERRYRERVDDWRPILAGPAPAMDGPARLRSTAGPRIGSERRRLNPGGMPSSRGPTPMAPFGVEVHFGPPAHVPSSRPWNRSSEPRFLRRR